MDHEQLFTAAKWEILTNLSKKNMSPLELSMKVSTSIANISQSLRFLEMAGIVKSKRVPNRDKGQPRIVYSIARDIVYPIVVSKNFTSKEIKELEPHRKAILKTWDYPIKKHQAIIEKFLWEIEPRFSETKKIVVKDSNDKKITFSIQPESVAKKILVKTLQAKGKDYAISIVSDDSEGFVLHALNGGDR